VTSRSNDSARAPLVPAATVEKPVSDRSFWALFAAGSLAYVVVLVLPAGFEDESLLPRFLCTVAPISLGYLVAWRRRDLLRPEASLFRTAGIHLVLGVSYAVLSGTVSAVLLRLTVTPPGTLWSARPTVLVGFLSFSYLLLYGVLAGFLMWTESVNRVQESRAIVAREAVLRAQAEAKVLRAQFNPHFVFNTLHSLMLLVRADPKAAERAIEDVAALIRYASLLDRSGTDRVPLSQELDMAEKYLALENLRLADRLKVEWSVAADVGRFAVPSFSLQTLLENAIKHGLSPKPEGGTVGIRLGLSDERLVLAVEDDGVGADPSEVTREEGRGLSVLGQRLAALYGSAASLTWRTAPGDGFSVLLEVPATPAGELATGRVVETGGGPGRNR
jgi:hypothetical protein